MRQHSVSHGKSGFYLDIDDVPVIPKLIGEGYGWLCHISQGTLHGRWDWMHKVSIGRPKYEEGDIEDEGERINWNSLGSRLWSLEQNVLNWAWKRENRIVSIPLNSVQAYTLAPQFYEDCVDLGLDDKEDDDDTTSS